MAGYSTMTQAYRENYDGQYVFGLSEIEQSKGNWGYKRPGTYVEVAESIGTNTLTMNRDSLNTCSRELKITGTYNRDTAMNCVNSWLDLNGLWYDGGIPLKSKTLSIDSSGADAWTCTLEYADATDEQWIDEVQITTVGGSAHIDTSYGVVLNASTLYGVPTMPTYQKIGIDMDGQPQGVDVKDPNVQITVTLNRSFSSFNADYMGMLLYMTSSVNATPFFGFPPGTLIFEGANVDRVSFTDAYDNSTMYRWRIQYIFYGMPNTSGVEPVVELETGKFKGYVVWDKNGWDYKWNEYTSVNIGGRAVQVCKQINVDRVYHYTEFRALGIPNNMFTLGENIDSYGDTDTGF